MQKFKISDLVDRDRYFRFTVAGLIAVAVILVAILLTSRGSALSPAVEPTLFAPTDTSPAGAGDIEPSPVVSSPEPPQSAKPAQTAFSQALLTSGDMNAILDIWSAESTDLLVQPKIEYNLSEAAGRTFVTRSKDFSLSVEAYHFTGEEGTALKVSEALKKIYLEELGYTLTELTCTPRSPDSWIIEDQLNKRILLGRVAGSNILTLQLTSEAAFDKSNAASLICSVAERQLESLRIAGYILEGSED